MPEGWSLLPVSPILLPHRLSNTVQKVRSSESAARFDKIVASGIADELHAVSKPGTPAVDTTVRDEAVSALTMLGFSPAPSAKVVQSILTEQPTLPVEQVVKQALKLIK